MLSDSQVVATIAVNDINAGKQFYGETLGLNQVDENPGGVTYECDGGSMFVYQSPTAGSGDATCAFWRIADGEFEDTVSTLREKGVQFQQYDDLPATTREGDIHIMDGGQMKAAWFKDPDGNILGLGTG